MLNGLVPDGAGPLYCFQFLALETLSMTTAVETLRSMVPKRRGLPWRLSECWTGLGAKNSNGYVYVKLGGKSVPAHRIAYELAYGPIPPGLVIDHVCRNRECFNPDHLEPVTNRENIRRGLAGQHNARKTHCKNGHPFDARNTRWHKGYRVCRACVRMRERESRAKKRAASRS